MLFIQPADSGRGSAQVVGTVSAVEFFLTLTVPLAFILHVGLAGTAGAAPGLLIVGVAAARTGAFAAKHIPVKPMLVMAGVMLTITSAFGIYSAWF